MWAPEFFRAKDPIVIRRWVTDIENAYRMSSFPDAEKVGYASCMLRDRARDWWGEVTSQVGVAGVPEMTWSSLFSDLTWSLHWPLRCSGL